MVKKVKAAYKKTDGSLKCSSESPTTVMRYPDHAKDLPSPLAEILHRWPAQGAVMPPRHRPINIPENLRTTTRNPTDAERTLQLSSLSQG